MKRVLLLMIIMFPLVCLSQSKKDLKDDVKELQEQVRILQTTIEVLKARMEDKITNLENQIVVLRSQSAGAITTNGAPKPQTYNSTISQTDTVVKRGLTPSTGATIYTGPRGGQYYINKNGNKTYIKRK